MNISFSDEKADFLRVQKSDSGMGMEDEQLEGLFKLDNSDSTEGTVGETGTGLAPLFVLLIMYFYIYSQSRAKN